MVFSFFPFGGTAPGRGGGRSWLRSVRLFFARALVAGYVLFVIPALLSFRLSFGDAGAVATWVPTDAGCL